MRTVLFVFIYKSITSAPQKILPHFVMTNYIHCIGIKLSTVIFNRKIRFQTRIEYGTARHNIYRLVLFLKSTYDIVVYIFNTANFNKKYVFVMKWNLKRKRFHEHPIFF